MSRYEKKGDKLYGSGTVPVLSLLLRQAAKDNAIPEEVSGQIFENALKASGMAASIAAAETAGISNKIMHDGILNKVASLPLKTKVIAGIVSGAIAISAIVAPNLVADDKTSKQSSMPITESTLPVIENNSLDTMVLQTVTENIFPISFKDKEIERYVRKTLYPAHNFQG